MICVIDYGAGNIGSVLNMIRKAGGQAIASADPAVLTAAPKLLLPGVGSFDNAMRRLDRLQLIQPLRDCAAAGTPVFGICLGMQLLSFGSEEGNLPGLGLIPGTCRRFQFDQIQIPLKIPHMGWNNAMACKAHPLVENLEQGARFYFANSYHYECENQEDVLFKSHYGYDFTSGVQRNNVMGMQCHPEKSHRFGMQLFKNFLAL
jgi:imidazole glycerol-phosphate synthase subunit HisH